MKSHAVTSRRAFTLVELLAVITIIALLAALLFPVVNRAIESAHLTRMKNNGRQIALGLTASSAHMGLIDASGAAWPRSGQFEDSTAFFHWVITNEVVETDFSLFGGPGLPVYRGLDPARFTPEHNAWNVVLDVTDATHESTPVFVTRNVRWEGDVLTGEITADPLARPFGDKYAVFVTRTGSAFDMRRLQMTTTNLNVAGAMNGVLYP